MIDRLAVIGDPIEHSLSPGMQSAALRHAGLAWTYEALRVPPELLPLAVADMRARGFRGFNVTIPHKETIRTLLDGEDEVAARVGAVNTVVRRGHEYRGFNTDVGGFSGALLRLSPDLDRPAVVFGAGGSARAVVLALHGLGVRTTVVSRDRGRASAVATLGAAAAATYDDPALGSRIASAGMLVNTTPLGMAQFETSSPVPRDAEIGPDCVAFDLVYGRQTPFLAEAQAAGARVSDGLDMLVEQGALAFTLWTGIEADRDVMRSACLSTLLERTTC